MVKRDLGILEHIHSSYHNLTVTERRVADYVLSNHEQVQFMSITQLAEECGTGEATISRFCRTLKLKGFNAFKIELAKCSGSGVQVSGEQDPATSKGRWSKLADLSSAALRQTLELLDEKEVERATELFERANHVMCMGSGGSMIMASTCAHLFSTVAGKFYAVSDSHTQMSAVATMGVDDAVVLFSYSGATTSGLQVLELAKSRGIPTVLITRFLKSPAAKLADVVLLCGSNEGPFQLGSIPAKVAQLLVMDVLFQEYCDRNRGACDENIQLIAAALAGKHI